MPQCNGKFRFLILTEIKFKGGLLYESIFNIVLSPLEWTKWLSHENKKKLMDSIFFWNGNELKIPF